MDNIILKEFYKKILPSVKNGSVSINGFIFNVEFQTLITDNNFTNDLINKDNYINSNVEQTLFISNIELFNNLLIKYVTIMLDIITNTNLKNIDYVYFDGNKKYIIDFILTNLWSNVTDVDLVNPINYLEKRINFLSDPLYDYDSKVVYLKNIDFLNNSNIEYSINLNNPIYETPYCFSSSINKENDKSQIYELPKIYYGISDNTCYIYAIKGVEKSKKSNSEYTKKIERLLYKVNKDINDDYELDDIKNVTPNAIVALTIFIKLLKENGINKINVIDYMPIRYKAKERAFNRKLDKLKEKSISDTEIDKKIESFNIELDRIQKNITDKFIRNFIRLQYQLGNIDIISYPKDVDSMMHIKINDNCFDNDNILNKLYTYDSIDNEKKKE